MAHRLPQRRIPRLSTINPVEYVPFAANGESNYRIAERFNVHESTVRRGLERIGYQRHKLPEDRGQARYAFDIDQPIVVEGNAMITGDWHVPIYDPGLVNKMIDKARELELTTLIIGGDFFNFDSLSQYDPKQDDAGLDREWNEGIAVMRVLLETFDRIIYIWGNHDARMHKSLGFKVRFADAMRMMFGPLGDEALDRIEFSNLDHCILVSGERQYYLCHPANYTSIPLSSARKIANKVNMNVFVFHSHHCAIGFAEDGEKIVVEGGGLFDKDKTAYLKRSTTFPTWAQGYSWVIDGVPSVYSPKWDVN